MSLTYLAFQKESSYFEKYPRETFSPDAGQRSRSIIPGDDPGDQEPSERRGFYPEPHAVATSAPIIKQVKGMSESQTICKAVAPQRAGSVRQPAYPRMHR